MLVPRQDADLAQTLADHLALPGPDQPDQASTGQRPPVVAATKRAWSTLGLAPVQAVSGVAQAVVVDTEAAQQRFNAVQRGQPEEPQPEVEVGGARQTLVEPPSGPLPQAASPEDRLLLDAER